VTAISGAARSSARELKNRRERAPRGTEPPLLIHENIRGPGYYH
jgi:hypothetical protein